MLKYRTGGGGIGKESKANIVGMTQKTTHLSVIQQMHNKGHRANLEFEPLALDGSSKTIKNPCEWENEYDIIPISYWIGFETWTAYTFRGGFGGFCIADFRRLLG